MTRRITQWGNLSVIAMLAGLSATPAFAQDAAAASAEEPGEIIVTANRREERAQDVGISLTAVSSAALETRNIRTAEDLVKLVPGLNSTSSSGTGVTTVVIRGVGVSDFNDHQEQPNATYLDGVYIPFSTAIGIPVFDVQRAEVLRGPQGTLFGRNATGGLIQYISNAPKEGTSGNVEGAYGGRDLARFQGALNIGSDKVAGRLAFYYQKQDGVIANTMGADRGDKEVVALRAQIEFTPDDDTRINLRAEGYNQDGTAPGYLARPAYYPGIYGAYLPENIDAWGTGPGNDLYGYRNPFKGLKTELNNEGLLDKRSRLYSMTIERDIGDAKITSITAYGKIRNQYIEDTDGTPFKQFEAGNKTNARQYQQDLRISGSSGDFRYTAGVFHLNIKGNYTLYNYFDAWLTNGFGIDLGATPESDYAYVENDYRVRTKSTAVYGQFEYDLSPQWTLIAGARYTWDKLRLDDLTVGCLQTIAGACEALTLTTVASLNTFEIPFGPVDVRVNNGEWSGKAQINFKPSSDLLFYASVSRGIKSAGFTAPLAGAYPIADLAYKPEKLLAYEVGQKAQFWDRRVTLNTSFYYYDYKDFQTFQFDNVATKILNRDADAYGAELELSARLGEGFNANFGAAYNHFDVHNIGTPTAGFPPGEDQRPINAPEIQLLWGLDKTFPVGDFDVNLNYSGRYIGNAYYNILNVPIVKAPGYTIHDLALRVESDKGYWVGAYLINVFDKTYQTGAFDVTFFSWSLRQYGEPRTFSIAAGLKF